MNTRHTPPAPSAKPDVCQPTGSAELAMLDVYMPMMKSSAILSAGKLGLFEALADGPLDIPQLADKLQSSPRGTRDLADFLVTIGYLERDGELFAKHRQHPALVHIGRPCRLHPRPVVDPRSLANDGRPEHRRPAGRA